MGDAETYWSPLCDLANKLRLWVRAVWWADGVTVDGDWGQLLLIPVAGYLEGPDGPLRIGDVEWVDISTCRLRGGLAGVPFQIVDASEEVLAAFRDTPLNWELLDTTWTIERFFRNEPVQLVRVWNPFGPPRQ